MGVHSLIFTISPTLNLFSLSWTANFFDFVTNFLYIGCIIFLSTSSGSYCGITFSSPRSTWSPLIPNFSGQYRLGTANTDTNYNIAIIRPDAIIIHTEDFLKTEVNWFK